MTTYTSHEELNKMIETLITDIDHRSADLLGQPRFFDMITLTKNSLSPAELGLLRLTSWCYVLFHEASKINIDFVLNRMSIYGLSSSLEQEEHISIVHGLRTFFQHNLDLTDTRDRSLYDGCRSWFETSCGESSPSDESEWAMCLDAYLQSTVRFLSAIEQCLENIAQDELLPHIMREWKYRQSRYIEPHEYDELIQKVAFDMGRESIDAVRMRKRYSQSWTKELSSLTYGFDFEQEARKLIESALLSELSPVIPVTGKDILDYFEDVMPGPEVGRLLKLARSIYEKEPCNKDALLAKVRDEKALVS